MSHRLFRYMFNIPNPKTVERHFKKRARNLPRTDAFPHLFKGLSNRFDALLVAMKFAPLTA